MKIVKRILLLLTAIGLMLVSQLSYGRHAALLIDAENGNILYEMEASQSWYPASLTKLMTLYMAFSALESGRLRLSDRMSVSSHAARQPTSKLGLRPWETITVEDAILAIVTRSANDAAVVLAERLAGTESQFAIKMTSTAHSLGMYGSHFMNATGLPHDWQTTTAHDMALLAWKISRNFPQFYPYFAVDSLYYNGRYLQTTNKFVASYPGAEGMKTGYTCGSGYNLVATSNLYGKRLIGVVLGGMTSYERYQLMFTMMDIGFSNEGSSYRAKTIDSMSKNAIGVPPYQLSCGHHPSLHYAARPLDEDDDNDIPIRYARKTTHYKSHLASHSRGTLTKIKIAGKTKTVIKQPAKKLELVKVSKKSIIVSKKSNTRISKTAVALASSKSTKKTVKAITKSKKSEKVIVIAKANTHNKGYYSPNSKSKKSTAASSTKGKGYYKPDSSSKTKTATKTGSKSSRTSKKKS